MEKDALLGIILSDVQEVETLLNSFKGKSLIKPAFIKLTLQKVDNIKHELELLRDLADEDDSVSEVQTDIDTPKVNTTDAVVSKPVDAEPVVPKPPVTPTDTLDLEPVVVKKTSAVQPPIESIPEVKPIAPAEKKAVEPVAKPLEKVADKTVQQQVQPHVPHPPKQTTTLGESLVTDKKSVLDKIHAINPSSNPALIGKPVDDIKKAIGLNDRFLYQRELFDNNPSLMNQTLDALNAMGSFGDALSFVKTNFTWDDDDDTTQSFMNLVHRKFK